MANFLHHILVCENERGKHASRPSCAREGGEKLRDALKHEVKAAGLKKQVRVTAVGCLDQCEHAAVMVVYPEQVWYGFVDAKDVRAIVQEHLVGGQPVERLRMAQECVNTETCVHRK